MTSLMACASRGLHIRAGLVQARTCSVPGCTGRSMARSPSMHTAALSQALQYHRISSPLSQRPVSQHSSQLDLSRGSHGRRSSHSLSRTFSKYGPSEILHSQTDLGVGSRHSLDRYLSLAHVLPAASSIGPSQLISHKPVTRGLHMSMGRLKEESKVEETLEAIKEKIKEKKSTSEAVAGQQQAADKPVSTTTAAKPKVSEATTAKTEPLDAEATGAVVAPPAPKKSLKERVVDELKHYYHGLRLFVIDIRVSARLIWKVLKGRSLNRREQKQLVRTTADMFRMVPFLVFIIIPFAEFLLPVAIKLFPGMLPSTFQEADKERDKQRQRLQVKLEMAKFLQDTIEEMAVTKKKKVPTATLR